LNLIVFRLRLHNDFGSVIAKWVEIVLLWIIDTKDEPPEPNRIQRQERLTEDNVVEHDAKLLRQKLTIFSNVRLNNRIEIQVEVALVKDIPGRVRERTFI
jgi:hypothetical protein